MFDIIHSMMDAMKLNEYDDESYLDEDDYDYGDEEFVDDIDEIEAQEKEKRGSLLGKLTRRKEPRSKKVSPVEMESQEEYEPSSYDDGYSDIENYMNGATRGRTDTASTDYIPVRSQPKPSKSRDEQRDKGARSSSKVTPMRSSAKRRDASMELNVQYPKTMEDAEMVADQLIRGNVVILSIEGLDMEVAQRIVDFTSGCCFALNGTFKDVTSYVFVFTPDHIPVSGDASDSRASNIPYVNAGY